MGRRFDPDRAHNSKSVLSPFVKLARLSRIKKLVLMTSPFTTLLVTPFLNFDPINPGKILVVSSMAGAIAYLTFSSFSLLRQKISRIEIAIFVTFIAGLLVPMLLAPASFQSQFWGTFGRNNGLLCYLSLIILLIGTFLISDGKFIEKLLRSLVITSVPFALYCVLQIFHHDPVKWSAYSPFGTLGNTNFSSAFLGMAGVATLGYLIFMKIPNAHRLVLLALFLLLLYCLFNTGSSQGQLILGFGCASLFGLRIIYWRSSVAIFFIPTAIAFLWQFVEAFWNRGVLAKYVYQETLTFRGDYMNAGIKMFLQHPLTGVGLDNYGNWYRITRGVISAYRTGFGRTSNTAHNIFIDLAASGGIVLLGAYVALIIAVFWNSLRHGKDAWTVNGPAHLIIFAVWFSYFCQTLISINQIGVGIWGWILGGALLGFRPDSTRTVEKSSGKVNVRNRRQGLNLSARDSVLTFICFSFFFVMAIIPMQKDAQFRNAQTHGDLKAIVNLGDDLGISNFLLQQGFSYAYDSKDYPSALVLAKAMTRRDPLDVSGWQATRVSPIISEIDRTEAVNRIKALDPYFPCLESNPSSFILNKVLSLSSANQLELAKWWKMPGYDLRQANSRNFRMTDIPHDILFKHLDSYCTN